MSTLRPCGVSAADDPGVVPCDPPVLVHLHAAARILERGLAVLVEAAMRTDPATRAEVRIGLLDLEGTRIKLAQAILALEAGEL